MSGQRQRGSFSARLRTEISDIEPAADHTTEQQDGFPCPRQIRYALSIQPLLHFFKYLQPLPDGRKLHLNLPATVVCEKRNGKEDVLSLSTDAMGFVVRDDKGPTWRKRLLTDFIGEDQQNAASLLSVGVDDVVAVRNVAPWRNSSTGSSNTGNTSSSGSGGGINSKALVLTRRAFDHVVSAPCELTFSVQQYVRCRGSHASIFRVTWGERENRRFAINIFNEKKITQAPTSVSHSHAASSGDEPLPLGTPLDIALQQMARLSPFYLVTETNSSDPHKQHEQLKLPRIRGNPVGEGLQAVKRIIDHVTAQLPGIKLRELTADFIKDSRGVWWFFRVVRFDACYRIEVPPAILQSDNNLDSATVIPEALRSKYFRQLLRTFPSAALENAKIPSCALCGCSCELSTRLRQELDQLTDASAARHQSTSEATAAAASGGEVFQALFEYRMTLKMVVTTLFQLRQRGDSLPVWEHVALLLSKTPAGLASEFTVCYLCYRIYKSQLQLARVATDLHEAYGVCRGRNITSDATADTNAAEQIDSITTIAMETPDAILGRIHRFYSEKCVSFVAEDEPASPSHTHHTSSAVTGSAYAITRGIDVDPTCLQLRLVFFFHELQDGGPELSPMDFYLEYHVGQQFTRLDFDGSKRHTPNRWQLCEARVQYLFTTVDGFGDYCNDKKLKIKMKTVAGDAYHGHTAMSLRPLLSAAKWYGKSMERESRVDYLLELKTDAFGLLTLKLTLGLLVDAVPLSHVRDMIKDDLFLRENEPPAAVYWPPPCFRSCSLVVPVNWIGALAPSEYVALQPVRSRRNPADTRRMGAVLHKQRSVASVLVASRQSIHPDARSPSQRFSTAASPPQSLLPLSPSASVAAAGAPGKSLRAATATWSTFASVLAVARRVIYRIAGEVSRFPTFLLGQILHHASFVVCTGREGLSGETCWTEPSVFALSRKYTIDSLFHGIDLPPSSTAALCAMGEILLVLSRCQLVPAEISVAHLEQLLTPYWLLGIGRSDNYTTAELAFEPLPPRVSTVPSQHRIVWNRAIRRCQVGQFCTEFRGFTRTFTAATNSSTQPMAIGVVAMDEDEEVAPSRIQKNYRTKTQAHTLCAIFEAVEASDSGYIDLAEFRAFQKCLLHRPVETAPPLLTSTLYENVDHLTTETLTALDQQLRTTREAKEMALVRCLMASGPMQHVLTQFDRLGCGGMNFDEFWDLADSVPQLRGSSDKTESELTTCDVFCLRHGSAKGFTLDRCCLQCAAQYQNQDPLPLGSSTNQLECDDRSSSSSSEDEDRDSDNEDLEDNKSPTNGQFKLRSRASTTVVTTLPMAPVDASESHLLQDDKALATTLEKLEAAEWLVRHRRESLGHAAVEAVLTERRSSTHSVTSVRRSSAVSTASIDKRIVATAPFAVTEFVTEAEERKHQAFVGFSNGSKPQLQHLQPPKKSTAARNQQPTISKSKLIKKTKRRARSAAQHSTRIQNSHSLSTLLRMELDDTTTQSGLQRCDITTRSTRLIETVHRGESKRKQLDRLVLAELDDVKQRLARLLESS